MTGPPLILAPRIACADPLVTAALVVLVDMAGGALSLPADLVDAVAAGEQLAVSRAGGRIILERPRRVRPYTGDPDPGGL